MESDSLPLMFGTMIPSMSSSSFISIQIINSGNLNSVQIRRALEAQITNNAGSESARADFGSQLVVKESSTPYTDATKTKKNLPGHIKRPMNAFIIWSRIERRKIWAKAPEIHNSDISRTLGAQWRLLSEPERRPYVEEAKRLRVLHSQEYPGYKYGPIKRQKRRRGNKGHSPPTPTPAPAPAPRLKLTRRKCTPAILRLVSSMKPKRRMAPKTPKEKFCETSSVSSPGSPPLNRIHVVTSTIKTSNPSRLNVKFTIDRKFKQEIRQKGESITHLTPLVGKVQESHSSITPNSSQTPSFYEEDLSSSGNGHLGGVPGQGSGSCFIYPAESTRRSSLQSAFEDLPDGSGNGLNEEGGPQLSFGCLGTIEDIHFEDLFSSMPNVDDFGELDSLEESWNPNRF